MKPLFKTPGKSAIDAIASFVGSYSVGLLITNKVYKEGQYSAKEAAIIATGFSTVSATFMIVVAKTLGLMEVWNTFFWSTLVITFVVTAISVRLPPIRSMDDTKAQPETTDFPHSRWKQAMSEGLAVAQQAEPLSKLILKNAKDGLLILQLPDPALVAKASATGLAEMFLPALIAAKSVFVVKYVVGVISISSILFFSASIPFILSTQIPISIKQILVVWYIRTVLTMILATPVAYFLAG